jgi:hypothetical protein
MPVNRTNLEAVFTFHDDPKLIPHYQKIRKAALEFALTILEETPESADQQAALRKVREAVMTANAAVALGGLI